MAIVQSETWKHHMINNISETCGDLFFSRVTSSWTECALICLLRMVCYMFEFFEVTNDCDEYTGIATFNTIPSQFSIPRVVYKGDTNCQRAGYTFVEDGNLCIYVINTKMTWDEANQTCEEEDGRMLVLTSQTKMKASESYQLEGSATVTIGNGPREGDCDLHLNRPGYIFGQYPLNSINFNIPKGQFV